MKITVPVYAKLNDIEYDLGAVTVEVEMQLDMHDPSRIYVTPKLPIRQGLSPAAAEHLLASMAP